MNWVVVTWRMISVMGLGKRHPLRQSAAIFLVEKVLNHLIVKYAHMSAAYKRYMNSYPTINFMQNLCTVGQYK